MIFFLKMFAFSLLLTIVIETALALLFRVRGKSLLIVILVNVLTNPIVVYLAYFLDLSLPIVLLPEAGAVLLEGSIYYMFNKKEGFEFRRPFVISLVLNAVSYCVGLLIGLITK